MDLLHSDKLVVALRSSASRSNHMHGAESSSDSAKSSSASPSGTSTPSRIFTSISSLLRDSLSHAHDSEESNKPGTLLPQGS